MDRVGVCPCLLHLLSFLDGNVRRWPVGVGAIIANFVVPALPLLHTVVQFFQSVLPLVVAQPCPEQFFLGFCLFSLLQRGQFDKMRLVLEFWLAGESASNGWLAPLVELGVGFLTLVTLHLIEELARHFSLEILGRIF